MRRWSTTIPSTTRNAPDHGWHTHLDPGVVRCGIQRRMLESLTDGGIIDAREPGRRSRTAEGAASLRALCRLGAVEALLSLPEQPFLRRLDTLAHSWISAFRGRRSGRDAMRAQIVGRARYAEDALLAQNPSQYLVLAAGLDTFALRHATEGMQGFEIDHPRPRPGSGRGSRHHPKICG